MIVHEARPFRPQSTSCRPIFSGALRYNIKSKLKTCALQILKYLDEHEDAQHTDVRLPRRAISMESFVRNSKLLQDTQDYPVASNSATRSAAPYNGSRAREFNSIFGFHSTSWILLETCAYLCVRWQSRIKLLRSIYGSYMSLLTPQYCKTP